MKSYWLFVAIAMAAVLSPGPGVLLTLTNAIRHGVSGAFGGILGIALGTFFVAGVSATSLGVLLATSSAAFNIVKYIGAAYLICLGVRLWRSSGAKIEIRAVAIKSRRGQFVEGLAIQLTNPKAVFFFMSVFPQFIEDSPDYLRQFMLLVFTYSTLVILIHGAYAFLAKAARRWSTSEKGGRAVNRVSGGTFMLLGLGLALSRR